MRKTVELASCLSHSAAGGDMLPPSTALVSFTKGFSVYWACFLVKGVLGTDVNLERQHHY